MDHKIIVYIYTFTGIHRKNMIPHWEKWNVIKLPYLGTLKAKRNGTFINLDIPSLTAVTYQRLLQEANTRNNSNCNYTKSLMSNCPHVDYRH